MNTQILNGDCIEMMRTLPDQSVNCCITSPPYFGLRDYGHEGQIGLEETPEAFVQKMVEVFREVKRVLRDDGTLWLNLGDSYYNYRPGKGQALAKQSCASNDQDLPQSCARRGNKLDGLKEKDLIGIPWRVAFSLQADGWYLRQDIIWNKPNPMPESVQDRCTKAHEYIFLLSKSPKYYFDSEAMKEPAQYGEHHAKYSGTYTRHKVEAMQLEGATNGENYQRGMQNAMKDPLRRNKRSVWTVTTKPYAGAHFATFPPDLIRPCILAGCPKGGVVLDPFGGSGTTAAVAMEEGRWAILCELNPDYIPLINERLSKVQPKLI
jgi:DNA modification methylase